jgi:hypothetical protein
MLLISKHGHGILVTRSIHQMMKTDHQVARVLPMLEVIILNRLPATSQP